MQGPTATKQFNVILNQNERAMLARIAQEKHLSGAQVIRALIRTSYLMDVEKRPYCVTGEQCRCAQMHVIATPAIPATNPDRPL